MVHEILNVPFLLKQHTQKNSSGHVHEMERFYKYKGVTNLHLQQTYKICKYKTNIYIFYTPSLAPPIQIINICSVVTVSYEFCTAMFFFFLFLLNYLLNSLNLILAI